MRQPSHEVVAWLTRKSCKVILDVVSSLLFGLQHPYALWYVQSANHLFPLQPCTSRLQVAADHLKRVLTKTAERTENGEDFDLLAALYKSKPFYLPKLLLISESIQGL